MQCQTHEYSKNLWIVPKNCALMALGSRASWTQGWSRRYTTSASHWIPVDSGSPSSLCPKYSRPVTPGCLSCECSFEELRSRNWKLHLTILMRRMIVHFPSLVYKPQHYMASYKVYAWTPKIKKDCPVHQGNNNSPSVTISKLAHIFEAPPPGMLQKQVRKWCCKSGCGGKTIWQGQSWVPLRWVDLGRTRGGFNSSRDELFRRNLHTVFHTAALSWKRLFIKLHTTSCFCSSTFPSVSCSVHDLCVGIPSVWNVGFLDTGRVPQLPRTPESDTGADTMITWCV